MLQSSKFETHFAVNMVSVIFNIVWEWNKNGSNFTDTCSQGSEILKGEYKELNSPVGRWDFSCWLMMLLIAFGPFGRSFLGTVCRQ